MSFVFVAVAVFVCLVSFSFGSMFMHSRLPEHSRDDRTKDTVRNIANIFVMITSLVFGLLINSAKNTFETINQNMHVYATDLIILDRMLRVYGPDATPAREKLVNYTQEAISHPARADEILMSKADYSGRALDALGNSLAMITPNDRFHETQLADMREHYHRILQQRWTIVEQSEGSIPMPLIGMLICWLTVIFASFGYRAPHNGVVVSMLLISAFLIACSMYLILDMNVPFSGPIQVSDQPIHRALIEMKN